MSRPPRDPKTPILTGALIRHLFIVGLLLLAGAFGLFEWELMLGVTVAEARTVAVNVFVLVELFYLFNCRSLTQSVFRIGFFSNPYVFGGVTIMLILQVMFTSLPAMNLIFHSTSIDLNAWVKVVAAGVITYMIVEVEELQLRRADRDKGT